MSATILDRFRLDGKTALITGAGMGIGRGYAHALGEAGAKVAVVDIESERAVKVRDELEEKNIPSISITADVRAEADVQKMIEKVVNEFGGLTIGVNNAGIGMWADSTNMPYDKWRNLIDVNLNGVFLCAREEAKIMIKAGYGKIINTASMSGHVAHGPQNQAAYNSSKAGIIHLTRSLAAEWAASGIRVNCISPGYTRTQMVQELLETEEGKELLPIWLSQIPLGRIAEIDDIIGAVVYLASEVSDYMTGEDLLIDGGFCTR